MTKPNASKKHVTRRINDPIIFLSGCTNTENDWDGFTHTNTVGEYLSLANKQFKSQGYEIVKIREVTK